MAHKGLSCQKKMMVMMTLPVSDAAFCICKFHMILSINRDYFLKQC
jgi:hypothetical protein